jgi:hypothetical protein
MPNFKEFVSTKKYKNRHRSHFRSILSNAFLRFDVVSRKDGRSKPLPYGFDVVSRKDNRRIMRLPSRFMVGERLGAPDGVTEQICIKREEQAPPLRF